MYLKRHIIRQAGLFLCVYTGLMLIGRSPAMQGAATGLWVKVAQALFRQPCASGEVWYEKVVPAGEAPKVKATLFNRKQLSAARSRQRMGIQAAAPAAHFYFDLWLYALWPALLMLSLALCWPVRWPARLLAAGAGMALFTLFLLLKWWIDLRYNYLVAPDLNACQPRAAGAAIIRTVHGMTMSTIFNFLFVLLCWAPWVLGRPLNWRRAA